MERIWIFESDKSGLKQNQNYKIGVPEQAI